MATFKVSGGVYPTVSKYRYFKITGPFAWTVSDGTVNLPVAVYGGEPLVTTYLRLADNDSVPNSAMHLVIDVLETKSTVLSMAFVGANKGAGTTGVNVIAERAAWADAAELQAAIAALGIKTVYIGGTANANTAPLTANIDFSTVVVSEATNFLLP